MSILENENPSKSYDDDITLIDKLITTLENEATI
jgi:hypothetical protein